VKRWFGENKSRLKHSYAALFLITLSVFLLTSSGHLDFTDEYMIFFQAESLVLNQSPAVPQAKQHNIWYGVEGTDGQPYSGFGLAHPIIIAPFYGLGKLVGNTPGIPVRSRDLIHYMAAIGSSSFFAALLVCLFNLVLSRLGVSPGISLTASLVLAFATPVWPYTGTLFSEIWTALLLLTALAALERETRQEQGGILPVVLCGVCLGLALMTRPNHGAAFPVFGLALLLGPGSTTRRAQRFLLLGAIGTVFLGTTMLLNYLQFGDPFQRGHAAWVEGGKIITDFLIPTPLHLGLYGNLFSPGKSVLLLAPPLLLALLGLRLLWRQRRSIAIACGGCGLTYILIVSRHSQWEGGYAWGPRYLLPVLPLLLVGLAPLLRKGEGTWPRRALVFLCLMGVLVQLPAVFTSSFEVQNSGGYYDANFDYMLDHNAVGQQWALFLHYLGETFQGRILEGPLHRGLDLWSVMLLKDGVAAGVILVLLALPVAMLAGGLILLRVSLKND
jgi:hypothetical protein